MKIKGGVQLRARRVDVVIGHDQDGKPVTLTLCPPRMGAITRLKQKLSPPPAPRTGAVMIGPKGLAILDEAGRPKRERDEDAPAFQAARARYNEAFGTAAILEAVEPGQLEFSEAKPDDHASPERWLAWYELVLQELEAAGLDAGAMQALSSAAVALMSSAPSAPIGQLHQESRQELAPEGG